MAAGLGFKTFTTGEVLTAADTNGYLMQGVNVFASAAARNAAITSPQEGQFAYLKDTDLTTYYTGSTWTTLGAAIVGPTFMAYLSGGTSQTVTAGVTTKIQMQSKVWDTATCYDTGLYRFTPNVSGYYQFNMCVLGFAGSGSMTLQVQKNGSTWINGPVEPTNSGTAFRQTMSGMVFLNGTTDYIEPYVTFSAGSPSVGAGTQDNTSFSAAWIRS